MIRLIAKLAALSAVGLGCLGWLAVTIGHLTGPAGITADTHDVTAEFADATGVVPGDEVRLAGVPVGKVSSVGVEKGKAVVGMDVDDRWPLPRGSRFELHWRNLLGQRYVQVVPPPEASPDGPVMKSGARVGTDRTGVAADLSALMDTAEPLLGTLDAAAVNRVMTTLAAALADREGTIGTMLDDSAVLVDTLAGRSDAIGSTIESFATLLEGLAARDEDIQRLLDELAATSTALAGQSEGIGDAMASSGEMLRLVDEVLSANDGEIDVVLGQLAQLATTLGGEREALGEGIRTLPWTSAALIRASNHGDWLQVYGRGFGFINTYYPEPRVGPDYSDVGNDDTDAPEPLLGQPYVPLPAIPETELGPITINPGPDAQPGDQSSGLDRLLDPLIRQEQQG